MNKLQQIGIEWGVFFCLSAAFLWLPFINGLPRLLGTLFLGCVFYWFGCLVRMWLEERADKKELMEDDW